MKKIIIVILSLISLNTYSFEHETPRYISGGAISVGPQDQIVLGIATPNYIWRDRGEGVTLVIPDVNLMEFRSNRRNTGIFTYKGSSEYGTGPDYPLTVSAPNGMTVRVLEAGPMPSTVSVDIKRSGDAFGFLARLRDEGGTKQFGIKATLEVTIPEGVPDGFYSLTTHFNESIYFGDPSGPGGGSAENYRVNATTPRAEFDLITYLNVYTSGDIDFGKVIFTSGANAITKNGSISISGGKNSYIKVKIAEPKVLLTKVGKGTETVPAFVKLVDGEYKAGDELEGRLDDTGRKDMTFEVRIEPGLYPDIPEGNYTGLARFEVKYS